MACLTGFYRQLRERMLPGDVFAFGSRGLIPAAIKLRTGSPISHVAVVYRADMHVRRPGVEGDAILLAESTTLSPTGIKGVSFCLASERIASVDGEVWYLPLSPAFRATLDLAELSRFLLSSQGKPYSIPKAIGTALDKLNGILPPGVGTHNAESDDAFVCSELVARAFKEGGAFPADLNTSEVTPIDLCRFAIYEPDYWQLAGDSKQIPGYNTMAPADWARENA